MARTPLLILLLSLVGCNHQDSSKANIQQAVEAAREQSQLQADSDPTRRPHPEDHNPLRRKLGDLQIKEMFFGPNQTQGDWMAYLPCSQDFAGQPVAPPNRIYLKRCPALHQYLLSRARTAGFADATANDVMDVRLSGAAAHRP